MGVSLASCAAHTSGWILYHDRLRPNNYVCRNKYDDERLLKKDTEKLSEVYWNLIERALTNGLKDVLVQVQSNCTIFFFVRS